MPVQGWNLAVASIDLAQEASLFINFVAGPLVVGVKYPCPDTNRKSTNVRSASLRCLSFKAEVINKPCFGFENLSCRGRCIWVRISLLLRSSFSGKSPLGASPPSLRFDMWPKAAGDTEPWQQLVRPESYVLDPDSTTPSLSTVLDLNGINLYILNLKSTVLNLKNAMLTPKEPAWPDALEASRSQAPLQVWGESIRGAWWQPLKLCLSCPRGPCSPGQASAPEQSPAGGKPGPDLSDTFHSSDPECFWGNMGEPSLVPKVGEFHRFCPAAARTGWLVCFRKGFHGFTSVHRQTIASTSCSIYRAALDSRL